MYFAVSYRSLTLLVKINSNNYCYITGKTVFWLKLRLFFLFLIICTFILMKVTKYPFFILRIHFTKTDITMNMNRNRLPNSGQSLIAPMLLCAQKLRLHTFRISQNILMPLLLGLLPQLFVPDNRRVAVIPISGRRSKRMPSNYSLPYK